jgi:hypothetical protein
MGNIGAAHCGSLQTSNPYCALRPPRGFLSGLPNGRDPGLVLASPVGLFPRKTGIHLRLAHHAPHHERALGRRRIQ